MAKSTKKVRQLTDDKTARKLFEKLPKQIMDKAINNSPKSKLKEKYISLDKAIFHSFQWDTTPEGFEYWKNIYDQYK